MSWIRLRQVALVAHDLDVITAQLHDALGLEIAYRDPHVKMFGLRNAVLPVGNQFIEVVSPIQEGTAGGRQLERLGGDGGYMVICHTDDHDAVRARVDANGVRTAVDTDDHGYHIYQLHPADTGGSFLEIDFQPGGEDSSGPWMPAGPDWQSARRTNVVDGITAVTVATRDVASTSQRWAAIIGCPLNDGVLQLDNATVTFVDGPFDTLVGVELHATTNATHTIGGVTFTLTP